MRDPFAPNIPKYFAYIALKGFGFGQMQAIWVIFLQQERGLTLAQVTLIDVAFWISAAVGELPTGIVADTLGRKTSLAIGALMLAVGTLGWAYAPTLPLILITYVVMGIGLTFISGAEDAFFYESIQRAGRAHEYTRLVGLAGAVMLGAVAVGSVSSGLLATIDLKLPLVIGGLCDLACLGVILTFKEAQTLEKSEGKARKSYFAVLRQAIALIWSRPNLRYPIFYLALVPVISGVMEIIFLQPQALALGVPIAAIGVLVMVVQIGNMLGASWADRIRKRFGETRVLYIAPAVIISSLLLLAALQIFPALVFIALIGFLTAVLRPILLNRIQGEVPDEIRATIISVQSLLFTLILGASEPILGALADHSGLPAAYIALSGGFGILILLLFWRSRQHFPAVETPLSVASLPE